MKKAVYIHGLGSGADSMTGVTLEKIFSGELILLRPEIPHDPLEAEEFLTEYIKEEKPDIIVASSQGAFYSMAFFPEMKKVLYNPAINIPHIVKDVIGFGKYDFSVIRRDGENKYELNQEYVDKLVEIKERLEKSINEKAIKNTYAVICDDDELLGSNTPDEFCSLYDKNNMLITHGGHRSTDNNLNNYVAKLVRQVLAID